MKQDSMLFENGIATEVEDIPEVLPEGAFVWKDIQVNENEFVSFLRSLNLPMLLLRKMLAPRRFPGVSMGAEYVILSLPMRQTWDQKNATYITFILQAKGIVSLHAEGEYSFGTVRRQLQDGEAAGIKNPASLFLYLLDSLIETNIYCFIEARAYVDEMAAQAEISPLAVSERTLLRIRRQMNALVSQFEDQFYSLAELHALTPHAQLPENIHTNLQALKDAQNQLARNTLRIERRVADLQDHCQFLLQQQTDQRLRQLTVLTALFLPLTLITGIYGMNFTYIPETTWRYGYFVTLGAMAVLAGLLLYMLKRNGWFK